MVVDSIDEIKLLLDGFFDLLAHFEGVKLGYLGTGFSPQELVDCAEGDSDIVGQLLEWEAFGVVEVLVGAVDQLDGCLVVEVCEDGEIFFHFIYI